MMKIDMDYCLKNQERSGRFMEACLLVLLSEKESYGYNLLERLKEFDYDENSINMSVIYRNLKRMEENDLITSKWKKSEVGPDKKIYGLTKHGFEIMDLWMDFLDNRIDQLKIIKEKYEEINKGGSR